jgi:DNA-binding LacI/PurR family transcriptional regulator
VKKNIKDVAKKAGVSVATVSRVLRNSDNVRKQTREKVLKAVSELNYEVNAVARNLRQEKTYSIGIILGNVLSQFYSIIAKSVEDTANKFGYNTILCNGDENPEKELNYLKVIKSNRVDGIIITPTGKNASYINHLINSGTQVVLLDRLIKKVDCDAVLVDNVDGAYKAVKHLISKGYKKIGIVNGYLDRTTGVERLEGYLKAIREAGIAKDNSLIKIGDFKKESGKKLTNELLKQQNKPEAIFTTNIDMSIGTLIAIKELNMKIPEDIGIVCFDDSDWIAIFEPPITVIRQPVYKLGSTACELLIKKIENDKEHLNTNTKIITLKTELIIRNSTKS